MRITDIELHQVRIPLDPFSSDAINLYHGEIFQVRTIVVLKTDTGLEGLGECLSPIDDALLAAVEPLRGTNPCAWLGHTSLLIGVAPAIYDLVGQANQVPAYSLFGPKIRSYVPFAYWTVSQSPEKMAQEVQRAVQSGYTWMKYHTDSLHNVIDQTKAMQEVAPPGFKVHYDVNFDNTVDHILEVAHALAKFPVAGLIEDPLRTTDFDGHRILRQKCPLPIIFHHLPLGGREALLGLADGYMLGHDTVGNAIRRAGLFEAANTPFMLQNVGGAITRALILHFSVVFERSTLHHVTAANLWSDDVVDHPFQVRGGTIQVSDTPGLGVRLNRERLERWKTGAATPPPKALLRVQSTNCGVTIFGRPPRARRDTLRLEAQNIPGLGEGYLNQVAFDTWFDDGSERFAALWDRTERELVVETTGA